MGAQKKKGRGRDAEKPERPRPYEAGKRPVTVICDRRLDAYFSITGEALAMAKGAFDTSSPERSAQARDCFLMASAYYEDAAHFRKEGHYINAYGALNYAHGWLDAGARLGLFTVKDSRLFTVDEK